MGFCSVKGARKKIIIITGILFALSCLATLEFSYAGSVLQRVLKDRENIPETTSVKLEAKVEEEGPVVKLDAKDAPKKAGGEPKTEEEKTETVVTSSGNDTSRVTDTGSQAEEQKTGTIIKIAVIEPNHFIRGFVENIPSEEYEKYKVVVFVKTDQWYIHPFMRGGDKFSYAKIIMGQEDNKWVWTIETVKRKILSERVAALLVDFDQVIPSMVENIDSIPHHAIIKQAGEGKL